MNQTICKVDFDDKKMKIDRFKLKKIILGTVRRDQFFYIDSQVWLQVQFLILQCFSLSFSIPFPWRVSYII